MYVLMHETAAGPDGVLHAGQVYNLPKKQAESLLAPGPNGRAYARKVDRPEVVAEVSKAGELIDD